MALATMTGCSLDLALGQLLHLESTDIEAMLWLRAFSGDEDKRSVV
jgi:hypothetical protein